MRHHRAACVYLKHVMFWLHRTEIRLYGTGEGGGSHLRLCFTSVSKLEQGALLRTSRFKSNMPESALCVT